MRERRRSRWLIWSITTALGLAAVGCTPGEDTRASLVDLTSGTAGSLVEIFVAAVLNHDITAGDEVDTGAPIADQEH
jgi:hypothetical protein